MRYKIIIPAGVLMLGAGTVLAGAAFADDDPASGRAPAVATPRPGADPSAPGVDPSDGLTREEKRRAEAGLPKRPGAIPQDPTYTG